MPKDIDKSRIYNVGVIPHERLRSLFRITSAHVYLTYPFVLSWSLLEAMSCSSPIIASETEPVLEVIKDNQNGLLIPFNNPRLLAKKICYALKNKDEIAELGKNARKTILEYYELRKCLNKQICLIDFIASCV